MNLPSNGQQMGNWGVLPGHRDALPIHHYFEGIERSICGSIKNFSDNPLQVLMKIDSETRKCTRCQYIIGKKKPMTQ